MFMGRRALQHKTFLLWKKQKGEETGSHIDDGSISVFSSLRQFFFLMLRSHKICFKVELPGGKMKKKNKGWKIQDREMHWKPVCTPFILRCGNVSIPFPRVLCCTFFSKWWACLARPYMLAPSRPIVIQRWMEVKKEMGSSSQGFLSRDTDLKHHKRGLIERSAH